MVKSLKELKMTPKRTEILNRLHLTDSEAILHYYPYRYIDYNEGKFNQWSDKDMVYFEGVVLSRPYTFKYGFKKSVTKFKVEIESEVLEISVFNRPWMKGIETNQIIYIVGQYLGERKVNMVSYHFGQKKPLGIQPLYSLKEGLNNKQITDIIKKTMDLALDELEEEIPEYYRQKYQLLTLRKAIKYVHCPQSKNDLMQALRTLKYGEFLRFNTAILYLRAQSDRIQNVVGKVFDDQLIQDLITKLPYDLTHDQIETIDTILNDLRRDRMMVRLVQGDVGSGKTIVAAIALYANALSSKQGAFMAPTEILARQHFDSLNDLFEPLGIRVGLLCGDRSALSKKTILSALKNNEIDILIGTHALFQDDVEFHDLGLVITDEQHRFGVNQRKKLKDKGTRVDFLLMSATPIPRTLATTLYGDMDISSIRSKPLNRKPVITKIVKTNSIKSIEKELLDQLDKGRQIYLLCNAIEDNERTSKNVLAVFEGLVKERFFKQYPVGLLHGKMDSGHKYQIMEDFKHQKIKILVTTTVIEVGVNIPNATVMVIYDASFFGLSQLHQLRGRITRGSHQGYCYLLSKREDESLKRLEVLVCCDDGFEIANEDLKLRGPGDLLGNRQSGLPNLILGSLIDDHKMLEVAKSDALEILANQDIQENQEFVDKVIKLNESNLIYVD